MPYRRLLCCFYKEFYKVVYFKMFHFAGICIKHANIRSSSFIYFSHTVIAKTERTLKYIQSLLIIWLL